MLKAGLIVVGCISVAFLVLLVIGIAIDEGGTMPEKIERECKKSYGTQGERAVLDCQLEMTVRYLKDADRSRADSTYSRVK